MKKCTKCKSFKDLKFFKNDETRKDGYYPQCYECFLLYHKSPEGKLTSRRYRLKTRFGITIRQYNEMLQEQNNSCALCKIDQSQLKRNLSVDHCHKTGKIRGLLCMECNTGIGKFKDSIELLEETIKYLKQFKV